MKHYSTSFERKAGSPMPKLSATFWLFLLLLSTSTLSAQTISINDPCTCREATAGSQGNATTLDNGQFLETLQVNSGNGEDWYIAAVDGFFDAASPQPPFTPLSYMTGPAGATFTESPAGVYTLPGVHIDALGYSISVTNGTDTLSISNVCAYPNPIITSELREGYCTNSDPIALTADASTSTGTGVFDVVADDMMTVVQADIMVFDPASLALGTYFLRYTFDEDDAAVLPCTNCNPGCVQAVFEEIDIVNPPISISCNDNINFVLGVDCDSEVLPDLLLEGDQDSYGIFDVNVYHNGVNLGNIIGSDEIGLNLVGEVVNTCSGNSCTTALTVADNMPPMIDCPTEPIQIVCTDDPDNVLPPLAVDACEGVVATDLIMEMVENFSCGDADGVVRRVFRTYTAEDSFSNSSPNCLQTIEVLRVGLADVVLPPSLDDEELPALECPTTDTAPEMTGFPTINNLPIDGDDFCTISAAFIDQELTGCGGSRKILRNWTIYDYCEPSVPDVNPIYYTQVIKIKDTTAPTIVAPADVTVSAFNADCTGDYLLPAATVEDACSPFSVSTVSSQGFMPSNGGQLNNLPLGIHLVIYTATDECGNQESDQMLVTVVDDVAPTPVCDELTVVSLDEMGIAEVPAVNLDDGSFDNCTDVSFLIRRTDGVFSFTEIALFDCEDANESITVEVQVADENGNTNSCMIQVQVQNESTPDITCPASLTIDCIEDTGLANTGFASANSNCALSSVVNEDISSDLNQCGVGTIVRQFIATDASGSVASCQQTITIENGNPLLETQVNFPENYAVTNCMSSSELLPENLPSSPINYGEPIINNTSCINVASSYSDEIFDLNQSGSVCYKINRTWAIMDWCNDGAITFTDMQIIEVSDNTAPILTCPENVDIDVSGGACDTTLLLQSPAIDDCSDNINLIVVSDLGNGFGPFPDVQAGIYNVSYFAEDECGNMSECSMTITIQETEPPVFTCGDGMILPIGADGTVTLVASIFNEFSSDNCTAVEDLLFSFTPNPMDSMLVFDCDDAGIPIFLTVWATDEAGNQSTCSVDLTIDGNVPACDDPLVSVSGMVITEEDYPVQDVTLNVSGTTEPTMTTNEDGIFEFNELPIGGDYSIVPVKDLNIGNGVSALDLSIISRHILNIQELQSPYKMIAADVNKSGSITTTDIVALRKVILQISNSFPNDNTSWRFVRADYEFSEGSDPLDENFPELVNFNNLNEPMMTDFIGIKIGDVNCSANPSNLLGADDRQQETPLSLMVADKIVEAGETFTIEFNVADDNLPRSLQFALEFSEKLSFIGVEEGWIQEANLGLNQLDENIIKACWHGVGDVTDIPVMQLTFRANEAIQLQEALAINELKLSSEAAFGSNNFTLKSINLAFSNDMDVASKWTLHQNTPNPFQEATTIKIDLKEPSFAKLTVVDVFGKTVYETQSELDSGMNYFLISKDNLTRGGIYLYTIETAFGSSTKKMIFSD